MSEHSEDIEEGDYQAMLDEVLVCLLEVAMEAAHLESSSAAIAMFQQRPHTVQQFSLLRQLVEQLDEQGIPVEAWHDASIVLQPAGQPLLRLFAVDNVERLTLLDVIEAQHLDTPEDERLCREAEQALGQLPTWRALEQQVRALVRRAKHLAQHLQHEH